MADAKYLLAIDHGTQSVRAVVFDLDGNLIAKSQKHIEPYFSNHPGWAEQDANYFWQSTCEACQGLWPLLADAGVSKDELAGLSVTTQRGTMVTLDKNNQPLRPAIIWLDQRRAEKEPLGLYETIFKVAGVKDTVDYFRVNAYPNWIKQNEPEVWAKTSKFTVLSTWLLMKLTGEFRDSNASQVGYQPFNFKKKIWAKKSEPIWKLIPTEQSMLPDLVSPGEKIGEITEQAAELTGLPEGLTVIASGSDKSCEVLGSGVLDGASGCLSFGTTATFNYSTTKYVEPIKMIPAYPAAAPKYYNNEVQIFRGFWMVSWFKENFGHKEVELAQEMGTVPEALFDALIKEVPAGSQGLVMQPYWTPGIRQPGPEARGALIGFGDVHSRAHVYRAIIEGIVYALREGMERTMRKAKASLDHVIVSGGGSQSDGAMQLTADIMGLPASRPHVYETSALGAAMNVAVGLGLHGSYEEAVAKMTRISCTFEPNAEDQKLYDQLYKRVYLKMYGQLKPMYEDLRELTGYPP